MCQTEGVGRGSRWEHLGEMGWKQETIWWHPWDVMDWERCEAGQGAVLLHQTAWEGFVSVSVGSATLLLFQQVVLYVVNLHIVVLYIVNLYIVVLYIVNLYIVVLYTLYIASPVVYLESEEGNLGQTLVYPLADIVMQQIYRKI